MLPHCTVKLGYNIHTLIRIVVVKYTKLLFVFFKKRKNSHIDIRNLSLSVY